MSRCLALMRFKDTGTILMGIYSGITDVVYPRMFPCEHFWNDEQQCYFIFEHEYDCLNYNHEHIRLENAVDVEIYSDYGGGFYWEGRAVEKYGYILPYYQTPFGNNHPFYLDDDNSIVVYDGIPNWAKEFMTKTLCYEID